MASGGIYDQLGGGFHRYSVDDRWLVPHFEKMLYDNALLAAAYLHGYLLTRENRFKEVCEETLDFVLRELTHPLGGFYSSLDADSEGEEGKYYVWTPEQLHEALNSDDAKWVIDLCDVTGTFEHGSSVLQLRQDPDDPERWHRIRTTLKEARSSRTYPGRDDKVVAAWNGLAITALTRAGIILAKPEYVEAAENAARLKRVYVSVRRGFVTLWNAPPAKIVSPT